MHDALVQSRAHGRRTDLKGLLELPAQRRQDPLQGVRDPARERRVPGAVPQHQVDGQGSAVPTDQVAHQ